MPSILIVGATGKQGGKAIATLFEQQSSIPDLELRFITRNPDSPSAKKLSDKGAKAYKADLFDKASLREALNGVDRAFLVTDAMAGEEKEAEQGKTFIDAAKEVGVKHIVFTSVTAADTAVNVPHFRSKYEVEKHLIASGLTYTILRPVAFMENFPPTGGIARFMVVGMFFAMTGGKPVAFVATSDIGVFAGKALADPTDDHFANKRIDLSAGVYGIDDVSRAVEKTQGYTPWFARYTPRLIRSLLPYDFRQMMIFFEESGYPPVDLEELRKIHPGLQSFEDWFRANTPKQ